MKYSRKLKLCDVCRAPVARQSPLCKKCWGKSKRKFPTRGEYARDWALRKKYKITLDEFNLYWIAFRGKCFICNKQMQPTKNRRGQGLDVVAVDHDHKTGKFRGLLCNACNKGIGLLNDDIEILKSAIKYLEGK